MNRRRETPRRRPLGAALLAGLLAGCGTPPIKTGGDPIRDGIAPPPPPPSVFPASAVRQSAPGGPPATAALASGLHRPLLGSTPLGVPSAGPLAPSEPASSAVPGFGPPPGGGPAWGAVPATPVVPAGGAAAETSPLGWADLQAELKRLGAVEQSLNRGDSGDWRFTVRVPDPANPATRRVRFDGAGPTPEAAIRQAVDQIRSARH